MQIRQRQLPITIAIGLGFSFVSAGLASIAPQLGMLETIALIVGIIGVAAVLVRPFIGLFLFVFLIQVGGLVNFVAGETAGALVLEGLAAVTFAGVVLQAPKLPRRGRWGGNPLAFRMALLFLAGAAVSTALSEFRDIAIVDLLEYVSLVLLFFLVIVLANTKERVIALVIALLASTALSSALSVLGYLGIADILGAAEAGGRQLGASNAVATTTGNRFLVGALMGALLALRSKSWWSVGATTFVLGMFGIIFSFSRAALLVFSGGLGWLGLKMRGSRHLPAVVLLAALTGVATVPYLPERVWNRFGELLDPATDWTLGRRWGYHLVGLDLFAESPVLGIGPGNYAENYRDFEYRWIEGRLLTTRALHNTYLNAAVENGIIGFGLFMAMLWLCMAGLQRVRTQSRDPTLVLLAEAVQFGFALFLIAIVTLPALASKLLWALCGISTAILTLAERQAESAKTGDLDSKPLA